MEGCDIFGCFVIGCGGNFYGVSYNFKFDEGGNIMVN